MNFTFYNKELIDILSVVSESQIENLINIILKARENNKNVFIIGNGGSAANASHLAQDLAKGTAKNLNLYDIKTIKAISLCDNVSFITAIANDDGYENIFKNQLKTYAAPIGDVLICISGSGNSKNILNAVKYAFNFQMEVVGITGFDGGKLGKMITNHVNVPCFDMGMVEAIHGIIFHYIISKIKDVLDNN